MKLKANKYSHEYYIKKWADFGKEIGIYAVDRFRHSCRILCRGRNGNVLIEFPDGAQMVTVGRGVRKKKPDNSVLCPSPDESKIRRILLLDKTGSVDILSGVCEHTEKCKVDCCFKVGIDFDKVVGGTDDGY